MRQLDRKILALAVPALGALVAEPLFIAVDTAMVGHLGASALAGLSIASTILQTVVGLMVFLAYATTPIVARKLGARDFRGAVQGGVDGLYLAGGLGVVLAALLLISHRIFVGMFGLDAAATEAANTYLAISLAGLPAMLIVFAATGLLRGLQDTRTPLLVAGLGFVANAGLNAILIYGLDLGIAGSALGTVIAQWGMVAVYLLVIHRHIREHSASWKLVTLREVSVSGGWLFVRTAGLRAALLITVAAAAAHGTEVTAAYQVIFTLFSILSFALDALAIAAQALIGKALGAGQRLFAKAIISRTVRFGLLASAVLSVLLIAVSPIIGRVFTSDPVVLAAIPWSVVILAVSVPIAAVVFVLDGVLMGAGDVRYLGWTSLVNLACYAPAVVWVWITDSEAQVALITFAYSFVFMTARLVTLSIRTVRRS